MDVEVGLCWQLQPLIWEHLEQFRPSRRDRTRGTLPVRKQKKRAMGARKQLRFSENPILFRIWWSSIELRLHLDLGRTGVRRDVKYHEYRKNT